MEDKIKFMELALKEADKALKIDEVPIGAIIVKDGKVISKAYNKKESLKDPTGHAEILAIKKACKKLDNWRLIDCELYVTLEPCIMCVGAIYQSRIKKVYFGAYDPKGGGIVSCIDISSVKNLNHYFDFEGGILKEECSSKINNYFKLKRNVEK